MGKDIPMVVGGLGFDSWTSQTGYVANAAALLGCLDAKPWRWAQPLVTVTEYRHNNYNYNKLVSNYALRIIKSHKHSVTTH